MAMQTLPKIIEITNYLSDCIESKTPVSFSKYGDGEFFAANLVDGHNCDNDAYTEKLKNDLVRSIRYMVDETQNAYVGIWHASEQVAFWQSKCQKKIKWAKYHTIIMDSDRRREKLNLFKKIKHSNLKKIYVCNPLLIKSKYLLNIDFLVHVPLNNWFDDYFDEIMKQLIQIINPREQYIVITSAGMGAKVLICELTRLFPNNIYLDFGSAIDKICTKKTSRGWEPSYKKLMKDLGEILPDNWNDSEFDRIYTEAEVKLGIHLTRDPVDSHSDILPLLIWSLLASLCGLCAFVLPSFLPIGGLSKLAYGWPLINWFAIALANFQQGISTGCFFVVAFGFGIAHPRFWLLLAGAILFVPPILHAVNIVHDLICDATSHNLLHFEFLIYIPVCLSVLAGSFLGQFVRRVL